MSISTRNTFLNRPSMSKNSYQNLPKFISEELRNTDDENAEMLIFTQTLT